MSRQLVRGFSPWRDLPLVAWLVAAAGVAVAHRWIADSSWLMLHLVLLGAVTHAIAVWSYHFAQTLLRSPAGDADRRRQVVRLALLAAGTATVLTGVVISLWPLTLAGALVVATAAGWHGLALHRMLRRALPARFRVTVRYYELAALGLLVGVALGATLAWGWDDRWHGRLLVAHALANLLGWMGLTVTGTLLTLWPTILRTRMDARAELWTRRALPVFAGSAGLAVAAALAGVTWLAALGLVGYLTALGLWGRGLWQPLRARPPREFAAGSVGAALVWLPVGLGWAGWLLVSAPDWDAVRTAFLGPAAALAAGFGAQIVTGALSYLIPAVGGGGPGAARAAQAWLNRAGGVRLIAINGGLALWLLPSPSWVKVAGSVLALLAGAAFLPLLFAGLAAAGRVRSGRTADEPVGPATAESRASRRPEAAGSAGPGESASVFSAGQVIAGLAALATAVVVGVGADPAAVGVGAAGSAPPVIATGEVVRVEVSIVGMTYVPSQVRVAAGDRLIVDLVNTGTTTHDLVVGQARTGRLAPGERAELDVGIIGESTQGYCSVVGHRQMGMVFDVVVVGAAAQPAAASSGHGDHQQPATTATGQSPGSAAAIDPELPPLGSERVHQLTLTVSETALEVAPGVWQKRWTYNDRAPGPTLHGRVGDVFEITLVNDGTIGHSIDFHAGALAPDRPMRTIEPGESLSYRFTATKAGVWMYHCATMPMSAHIAAGMAGAVVIEPEDLPPVDRSYLLVQSEVYLQTAAATAAEATEVDAGKVTAEQPDYVVFNGIANAYDTQPLVAKVGERVRFWVLDVGPNRPSSFHIVGAQFDTVYFEGAYLLRGGKDAFGSAGGGSAGGGSQALGLQPAQGGFVETVFPEAGRYPMVSHVMVDAERGAHGYVQVTE